MLLAKKIVNRLWFIH